MHICIIIPCYNEANRLPIKEFIEYLGSSKNIDICFVNDGSKDKTINIIENIKSQYPDKVLLVNLENNVGKAEAVRIGILEASKWKCFDYVGFMDADLATPLKEIDVFKKYILEYPECKAFLGSRIQRLGSNIKRSAVRHYFGRVFATFASLTLGIAVYDTQCGAKIFETKIAEKIFLEPFYSRWLFDIEFIFRLIKLYGKKEVLNKVIEIPLQNWTEKGASKISPFYVFKVPFELLKIRNKYKNYGPK